MKYQSDDWRQTQDVLKSLKELEKLFAMLAENKEQENLFDRLLTRVKEGEDIEEVLKTPELNTPEMKGKIETLKTELGLDTSEGGGPSESQSLEDEGEEPQDKTRSPSVGNENEEDSSTDLTPGEEVTGTDTEGNEVSGVYLQMVFGRPLIETPSGDHVTVDLD